MISIIIPLYNKERQIKNTLESVFNQTFQEIEVVIVNDGSTDASVEVVQEFTDNRICLIHQANQGVSAARNRGIQEAKYEYIALLDADDEWKPEYLQSQIHLIEKYPECGLFACAYEFRNSDNQSKNVILNKIPFEGQGGLLTNYFEVASCSHPPLWTSAVVIRREALMSIGGFPIGVIAGEDLLTWAKLAVKYQIAYSLRVSASFVLDERHNLKGAPPRRPSEYDVVGKELANLYQKNKNVKGLKEYIALWHKMRASIYLRLNENRKALKEIVLSLRFNPLNKRVWVYFVVLALPVSLRYKVFRKFNQ